MNMQYDVQDAAEALGVTPQTVRLWIKDGLPTLNSSRPILIMGFHLRDYIENRFKKTKHKLALGEFYCMRCRVARKPFGMMADYVPLNAQRGRLEALCGVCDARCSRLATEASLLALSKALDITRPSEIEQETKGGGVGKSLACFGQETSQPVIFSGGQLKD